MSTTVTTQGELDKALADKIRTICIDAPAGVWIRVSATGSSHVVAWGSSHVEAWGSSHVVARGSSHVVARGSSHVVAWESSHVVAWESSHVEAWGSSHVVARESSHVEAGRFTAVHLHSQWVTLDSRGAVIDMTAINLDDPAAWADYYGAKVDGDKLIVFKGVDDDLYAGHMYIKTQYPIGKRVRATDWAASNDCGYGLHFSPSPSATKNYTDPKRFLAVEVSLKSIVCLGDKIKAPACKVLYEVDSFGDRLEGDAK